MREGRRSGGCPVVGAVTLGPTAVSRKVAWLCRKSGLSRGRLWGPAWGQASCPLRPLSQGWTKYLVSPPSAVHPRAGKWSKTLGVGLFAGRPGLPLEEPRAGRTPAPLCDSTCSRGHGAPNPPGTDRLDEVRCSKCESSGWAWLPVSVQLVSVAIAVSLNTVPKDRDRAP